MLWGCFRAALEQQEFSKLYFEINTVLHTTEESLSPLKDEIKTHAIFLRLFVGAERKGCLTFQSLQGPFFP